MAVCIDNDDFENSEICETCANWQCFPVLAPCYRCIKMKCDSSQPYISGSDYVRRCITKYDQIRGMSKEQLASLFIHYADCAWCDYAMECNAECGDRECHKKWMEWLDSGAVY